MCCFTARIFWRASAWSHGSYEEVLQILPVLHRYGLNYNNFIANTIGYKGFAMTTPFIYQSGGVLYREGDLHVQLDDEATIRGLKLLTDSFTIYDMDFEINSFYQSFRDGTLPIRYRELRHVQPVDERSP